MRVQPQTLAWLERYGLRWDLLVMRARGDYSQVTWFKRDSVEELRAYGFDLRLAFEDDPNNFAMFHAALSERIQGWTGQQFSPSLGRTTLRRNALSQWASIGALRRRSQGGFTGGMF